MRNEKGFSLIEMLAIILIASTVLLPLLVGLTGNIRVNDTMINRSIAATIAATTLQTFETMYFKDLEEQLNNPDNGDGVVLIFNAEQGCENLKLTAPSTQFYIFLSNRETCNRVFEIESINRSFESEQFMVFIYPFTLESEAAKNAFDTAIDQNENIPEDVKAQIKREVTVTESGRTFRVLRVLVWINYGEQERQSIVRTGLLSPELELD